MNKKDYLILKYKNRIATLESRTGCSNGNIIRKLQRQIRNLEKN